MVLDPSCGTRPGRHAIFRKNRRSVKHAERHASQKHGDREGTGFGELSGGKAGVRPVWRCVGAFVVTRLYADHLPDKLPFTFLPDDLPLEDAAIWWYRSSSLTHF